MFNEDPSEEELLAMIDDIDVEEEELPDDFDPESALEGDELESEEEEEEEIESEWDDFDEEGTEDEEDETLFDMDDSYDDDDGYGNW